MEWISIKDRLPDFVKKYESEEDENKEILEIESVSENVLCLMLPTDMEITNLRDRCPTLGNFRKIEYFRIGNDGEKIKINSDNEDWDYYGNDYYYWWLEFLGDDYISTDEKGLTLCNTDGIEVTHWAVVPKFPSL